MVDYGMLAKIITLAISIAAAYFGTKYKRIKKVIADIDTALEDDTITKDELKRIVADALGD